METMNYNNKELRKPTIYNKKHYQANTEKMMTKIKKIMLIAGVSATVGVPATVGISVYNNQQITRQAESFDNQITDYNYELYNKIQSLKEDGLSDLSNDDLRALIEEVSKNNFYAIKDKIASVIPDYSTDLKLERHDSSVGAMYFASYKDKDDSDSQFMLNDSIICSKVDRYIGVSNLIKETENGDIDRKSLEKELDRLSDEMKEDANIGVYFNTKDGSVESDKLKTYSISKNKNKIEKKLYEMHEKTAGEEDLEL